MIRNASEDYVYDDVTVSDVDTFTITVADSGGTSGDSAAYVPAFGATVTDSSGDVTAISITAPGALSGSCQLHGLLIYANNQETSPMTVTLPAGTQEGAGTFGSKTGINVAQVSGINADGTGNSGNLSTLGQQWNLGSNFNQLKIVGVDNFSPIIVKAQLF